MTGVDGAITGWASPINEGSSNEGVSDVAGTDAGGGGGGVCVGGGGPGRKLVAVGWRRVTLYVIVLSLLLIVFVNIGLTLWIITVLRFSADGIGPLRIVEGGMQLSGRVLLTDQLVVSSVATGTGRALSLQSYRNFSVNVFDADGKLSSQLVLKKSGLKVISDSFHITTSQGRSLLSAEGGEVRLGADSLSLAGEGGIMVNTSLQTPAVRAEAGRDLVLESPTRSLKVKASQDITLQSSARGITAHTHGDIRLVSAVGAVQLDAANVYIHNLTAAKPSASLAPPPPARRKHDIYQLCACSDGKLFLVRPDGICQTQPGDDVCR